MSEQNRANIAMQENSFADLRRLADSLDLIVVMLRDDSVVRTLREETAMRLYCDELCRVRCSDVSGQPGPGPQNAVAAWAWAAAERFAQRGEDGFVDLSADSVPLDG